MCSAALIWVHCLFLRVDRVCAVQRAAALLATATAVAVLGALMSQSSKALSAGAAEATQVSRVGVEWGTLSLMMKAAAVAWTFRTGAVLRVVLVSRLRVVLGGVDTVRFRGDSGRSDGGGAGLLCG